MYFEQVSVAAWQVWLNCPEWCFLICVWDRCWWRIVPCIHICTAVCWSRDLLGLCKHVVSSPGTGFSVQRSLPSISARMRTLHFDRLFPIAHTYGSKIICADCFPPLTKPSVIMPRYLLVHFWWKIVLKINLNALYSPVCFEKKNHNNNNNKNILNWKHVFEIKANKNLYVRIGTFISGMFLFYSSSLIGLGWWDYREGKLLCCPFEDMSVLEQSLPCPLNSLASAIKSKFILIHKVFNSSIAF